MYNATKGPVLFQFQLHYFVRWEHVHELAGYVCYDITDDAFIHDDALIRDGIASLWVMVDDVQW